MSVNDPRISPERARELGISPEHRAFDSESFRLLREGLDHAKAVRRLVAEAVAMLGSEPVAEWADWRTRALDALAAVDRTRDASRALKAPGGGA